MRKNKMRSDSTWRALSRVQREQLDDWLFEEGLGYADVLGRVQKDFGLTASKSALSRYYQRRQEERALEDLTGAERTARTVNGTPVKVAALRDSSLKLIGMRLLHSSLEGRDVSEITRLARVLLENDLRNLQRERLELDREKFHFDAAEAALAEIPRMQETTAEDYQREKARVNGMIARLFGKLVPGVQPPQVYDGQNPEDGKTRLRADASARQARGREDELALESAVQDGGVPHNPA
jgi:hypothetical protein